MTDDEIREEIRRQMRKHFRKYFENELAARRPALKVEFEAQLPEKVEAEFQRWKKKRDRLKKR